MDAALIASAALLGLAGAPHCTAMCGAPCAAAIGRSGGGATVGFHLGRLVSYAVGGALVASSVGALAGLAQWSPVLKPLWTLLHVAALALGLWLIWQGRQPQWMASIGRAPQPAGAWRRVHGPTRATLAGTLWVGWPCGLLQSALLVASLTQGAAGGAAAMAAFAMTSSAGLWLAPWVWQRMGRAGGAWAERWAVRAAGAMLVAAAGWSLGHGLWARVVAYCFPAG
jgi:hypothetical protein